MSDINETLDALLKVKELFKSENNGNACKEQPKCLANERNDYPVSSSSEVKSLELALEEQRRDYDILHSLHEALKIKNITFLTIAFGVLGYLYSAGVNKQLPIKQTLFIPSQTYGVIFYIAGILMLLGAIAGFIITMLKNRQWHTAFDDSQERKLMDKYEEYLEYMHRRYLKVSSINGVCYEKRRSLFNLSLYSFFTGATILLLIKTFGG